ncbi:MAG: phosphotransferase [Candidatus Syntropharchaeia archaeon]
MELKNLEKYLEEVFGEKIKVTGIRELGGLPEEELKGFGYGKPYLINFEVDGERKSVVLSSMKGDEFGHDHFSDRAGILLWQHSAFNSLPRHVKSIDVGYFTKDGKMKSAGGAEEYFILMEKVEGEIYFSDLERIGKEGSLREIDIKRAKALSSYLAEIHSVKKNEKRLYIRKIRDLVGHGECIFGLIDSYPENTDFVTEEELEEIEKGCVKWRWKLKKYTHRLCMTHGDFHPYNVMFREGTDFTVLDRSRGEWGEAADDVSSMTINYMFHSLKEHGRMKGAFKRLYELFFDNYLEKTQDWEILRVIQPFYVFRGLVVASPIWYPTIEREMRKKLFNFIKNMLEIEEFNYKDVNKYL